MAGPNHNPRCRRMRRGLSAPWRGVVALVRQPYHTLACLLTAALVVASFPPFDLFPLLFVAYVPLLAVVMRSTPRQAFFWGWLTGIVIVAFGFYFIQELLQVFGGLPGWISYGLHLLFSAYQGIGVALFAALTAYLTNDKRFPLALVAPLTYVAMELVTRPLYIFPFHMGNATYLFLPFIQVADLTGVLGLTGMVLLVNSTFYLLSRATWRRLRGGSVERWPVRSVIVTVLLFGFCLTYGFIRIDQVETSAAGRPTIRIGLVEADIGIFIKANPQRVRDNLLIHQNWSARLAALGADLIVWPETAVNLPFFAVSTSPTDDVEQLSQQLDLVGRVPRDVTYFRPSDAELVDHVQQDLQNGTSHINRVGLQRGFRTPLLFGVLTSREPTPDELPDIPPKGNLQPRIYYNTAILIDAEGRVLGSYDKNVLLVFGEWVPLSHFLYRTTGFNFFQWVPTAGDVTPGEGVSIMTLPFVTESGELMAIRIGAMICYEDIIASYGLRLAHLQPNLFINLINDGWFQTSSAAHHHMAFSVFRSVEHRLPLIRSTNTGVSSIIDPVGRIVAQTWLVGAATRLEDARNELDLAERLDEELAMRLMAVERALEGSQNELIEAALALEALIDRWKSTGVQWEQARTEIEAVRGLLEDVGAGLPENRREIIRIENDLRRAGPLSDDVADLLAAGADFVEQVTANVARADRQLSEGTEGAMRTLGSRDRALQHVLEAERLVDRSWRMLSGPEHLIEDVPIMPPPTTLYSMLGDWFAWSSLVLVAAMWLTRWLRRFQKSKEQGSPQEGGGE